MIPNIETGIFGLISNFILEISKIKDFNTAHESIENLIKSLIDIENFYIFKKENDVIIKENPETPESDLSDIIKWSFERSEFSIFPEDNGSYIVLPVGSKNKIFFVYAAFTKDVEFSNQIITLIKIISFLAGNQIENIYLYNEILEKNTLIEKNKNFLDNILNTTKDCIAVITSNLENAFSNSHFSELSNEITEKINEQVLLCFSSGNNSSVEITVDEKTYGLDLLLMENNSENMVMAILRDISGTKELERLKKIDKMKMEFLSMISHELRTPLSAIKAYSETIVSSEESLEKEMLDDFMNTILNESYHLEKLLNDLLDFSKLELKTLKIETENFDIVPLIKEIINSMADFAKNNSVNIISEITDESIDVTMDKTRMRQILLNLLQNSIKYSDPEKADKWVKISLNTSEEEKIQIVFEDNGIGIDEKEQSKVFEKFYRVDSSLNYKVQGTGIGLSIVKDLVQLHNGTIDLESSLKKGSKFILTFNRKVI